MRNEDKFTKNMKRKNKDESESEGECDDADDAATKKHKGNFKKKGK